MKCSFGNKTKKIYLCVILTVKRQFLQILLYTNRLIRDMFKTVYVPAYKYHYDIVVYKLSSIEEKRYFYSILQATF